MGHMLSIESPVHQDHSVGSIKPAGCLNTWQWERKQKQREKGGTTDKINKTAPVTDVYRWCRRVTDNSRNVAVATKGGWKILRSLLGTFFRPFPLGPPFESLSVLWVHEKSQSQTLGCRFLVFLFFIAVSSPVLSQNQDTVCVTNSRWRSLFQRNNN